MKLIPYSRQKIDKEDINSVTRILKSDYLTQGPEIVNFEKKLCDYTGVKYALVLNSGTSALHAAYFSLGLQKNDEIITTPNSFVATANAALYLGAIPVFADIDIKTGNIDFNKIESLINTRTKIIVPVHYAGYPVDLDKIKRIANKYNLFIVEDACHALGAEYKNSKIGNCKYSNITILSFHPVKHITTGEGGAILTNNKAVYEKVLMFRSHGITKEKNKLQNKKEGDWYYEMQNLGFNYRMSDIQAALGISQLQKIDKFVNRRRKIAGIYAKYFKNNPYFNFPKEEAGYKHAYHLFPIKIKSKYMDKKREIFEKMRKSELWVQVHYIPIYLQPYYQKIGYKKDLCPNSEIFYKKEISIPIYPSMSNSEINKVIKIILNIFQKL